MDDSRKHWDPPHGAQLPGKVTVTTIYLGGVVGSMHWSFTIRLQLKCHPLAFAESQKHSTPNMIKNKYDNFFITTVINIDKIKKITIGKLIPATEDNSL